MKIFWERFLARFGVPKVLILDNGIKFAGKVLGKYLEEIVFTAPSCPQENPTEITNRTIKTMIALVSHNQHNRWGDFLPEISLAIYTAMTGCSIANLV